MTLFSSWQAHVVVENASNLLTKKLGGAGWPPTLKLGAIHPLHLL